MSVSRDYNADVSYLSYQQVEEFRQRLLTMRAELVEREKTIRDSLSMDPDFLGDEADHARRSLDRSFNIVMSDRNRSLLKRIEAALQRIERGEYGYCEDTGEEIGLQRLLADPLVTLCVEAQKRKEHYMKLMRAA